MFWHHLLARLRGQKNHPDFSMLAPVPGQLPARQANFLVLDLETSGLDSRQHQILSAGWICINQLRLDLASTFYSTVRLNDPQCMAAGQSTVIHGLHQAELAAGISEVDLIREFLQAAANRVLVCHHQSIEKNFLLQAFARHYQQIPPLRFVDTLALEQQRLNRQGSMVKNNELSLNHCLKRHGLPQIQAHNALEDAYGCALLLLNQIKQRSSDLTVKALLNPHLP